MAIFSTIPNVKNKLIFIPFQSFAGFQFNSKIEAYHNELASFRYEEPDEFNKEYYHSPDDGFVIGVRKGLIENFFCYQELYYCDTNLIGLNFVDFQNVVQIEYIGEPDVLDFEDDGLPQTVYSFDGLGLQVWVKNNRVVTIIANNPESYSDEPFEE